MVSVSAPTRLHFGLVRVPEPAPGERRFGGCGLMLASPRVELAVTPSDAWHAEGRHAGRALAFAGAVSQAAGFTPRATIHVTSAPDAHTGLGLGTALGFAVARGLFALNGRPVPSEAELGALTGRGRRSAIGVHGARLGGFVVDGGVTANQPLGPLLARHPFPDWPVVLVRPDAVSPWHGTPEQQFFARPQQSETVDVSQEMCYRLMMQILPALVERDYDTFATSLTQYNQLAGRAFINVQGGNYASPRVESLVNHLLLNGPVAAGQSSWGPTVFVICRDSRHADEVSASVTKYDAALKIITTTADNAGTVLQFH